jgi:hypothetical protein
MNSLIFFYFKKKFHNFVFNLYFAVVIFIVDLSSVIFCEVQKIRKKFIQSWIVYAVEVKKNKMAGKIYKEKKS